MFYKKGGLGSNEHDDEINLPRGPREKPRPCPLCFINSGYVNVNFGKTLSPQNPQIKMLTNQIQPTHTLAQHTNGYIGNGRVASVTNSGRHVSEVIDASSTSSYTSSLYCANKQANDSDNDVVVIDAPIKPKCEQSKSAVKEYAQMSTSGLKRVESKLVKTPKLAAVSHSETNESVRLDDSKCKDADQTDRADNKIEASTSSVGKELAPDTTERLPHTRQLSSAILQLSPRHHPTLLTKLGTTNSNNSSGSSSSVDAVNSTTSSNSSSGGGASGGSTSTMTSSVASAAPPHVLVNKCPSLASVNSYYLNSEETVVNTSDEYYDEEHDGEFHNDDDDDDDDDANEVFVVSNHLSHRNGHNQVLSHIC